MEIEEAVSKLAESPFDAESFPYAFLEAFGNKQTTIQRLRSGSSNKSDIPGGVLQNNNIHIVVAESGKVSEMLSKLRDSSATNRQKAKFILSTDGTEFQAEDLTTDDPPVICSFSDFHNHFGFFLPLAGISTVKQIRESSFDIKATGRLNRLYVELLKDNPDWGKVERRHDMNHFVARLIFCFFAEDTGIFNSRGIFSKTVEQMSERDSSNTHEVISEIFRAMNTGYDVRAKAKLPRWVGDFPYVNGGLFSGSTDVPRFSKIARSYLLHIGNLEWMRINPDIFGSMIQAVAEDEERGSLGMHYTSVPNILKVLNPLFLDDLRSQLEKAGDNSRALLNLRKRISKIRVFDPACGSGNFLVIAYKEMRAIEAEINRRREESEIRSEIKLTNFRGIELRDFPAEIARLALIIAEYQCDVLYRGQMEALLEFLPLDAENWIVNSNALRIDWDKVCPIPAESENTETYLCGNPPYLGSKWQSEEQKSDLENVFQKRVRNWKSLDYVCGWFMKAADYGLKVNATAAFVATNSICQGQTVPILWPTIFASGHSIVFAHTSFKWANLASNNAGVTVVIVAISKKLSGNKRLFSMSDEGTAISKEVNNINAYLVAGPNIEVQPRTSPRTGLAVMQFGNHPYYGTALTLTVTEAAELIRDEPAAIKFIRPFYGSKEFVSANPRSCIWIYENELAQAMQMPSIAKRINETKLNRLAANKDLSAQRLAETPYRFREQTTGKNHALIVPRISSENRPYLPVGILDEKCIIQEKAFALYDAPLWNMSLVASRLHWVWIGTVCVRMRMDFSYSNTLGWNTFPVPKLTEQNKVDLTRSAEEILLAREAHFPAAIADLYESGSMPEDLYRAHERNDDILERIYLGRRFKNDSERLEKLFELYTKMFEVEKATQVKSKPKKKETLS